MNNLKVLIVGAEFNNQGAYLMLRAVVQAVQERLGGVPVLEHTVGSPQQKAGIGALSLVPYKLSNRLQNRRMQKVAGTLLKSVSVYDIDLVLDASGFRYGDQWKNLDLATTANRLRSFSALGVPVFMLPQAFGPFEATEHICADVVSSSRLVFARDPQSAQYLKSSVSEDLHERIHVSPDFTGPLAGRIPSSLAHLAGAVPIIPNWNIIERAETTEQRSSYKSALAGAVDALRARGVNVYGLSHEAERDTALLHEIAGLTEMPLEIVSDLDGLSLKGLIGTAPLIVSGRYHAISSALSQGVPVIAHGWSHKYRWLLTDYDVQELLTDPYAPVLEQTSKVLALLADESTKRRILCAGEQVEARVEAMWDLVRSELKDVCRV
ncbi:hypothetical protein ARZXY2_523 [Arthrobacter sp. ZXY-2]|nr:hypothetical protein ARZXY2_523 [Arthrobacter sp. ZXY-2]